MVGISDEELTRIHKIVYEKHGYTFQEGLRAFKRGRRWAKSHDAKDKPPRGIAQHLLMWAQINKLIQIHLLKQQEGDSKNAKQPTAIKAYAGSPVTQVSSGSARD